ncbi:MAG: exodeoxyribonuclease VII small subunit [Bdellovibrionales bacterium]|nr:exodeoxyribonuclease VII small subunit [Bdellovibrionales bacterium]
MATTKEKKFETAIEELETIVSKLESDDLPLEDSLTLFEKGIGLSKTCSKKLEEAEKKVDALLKDLSEQAMTEKEDDGHVS